MRIFIPDAACAFLKFDFLVVVFSEIMTFDPLFVVVGVRFVPFQYKNGA